MGIKNCFTFDLQEPTGIFPDVFHDIQRTFNFSYVVSSSVDGTWGRRRPNSSTFSGLVGQLQRKEADIAITIVIISPERAEVVDASFNIMEVGSRLFVRLGSLCVMGTAVRTLARKSSLLRIDLVKILN